MPAATAAELADELERAHTRLAAVGAAGDALAYAIAGLIESPGADTESAARTALSRWRSIRPA